MPVKLILLYTDADVYKRLARELRRRGYDAVSAIEVGMREATDAAQLEYATSERRAILTFNQGHFVQLHIAYINQERVHCGIIVSLQYSIGETLRRVIKLVNTLSAEEMRNRLEYLSQWGN
jgi:predicted nuclease of predicted toxin-antitoxin system